MSERTASTSLNQEPIHFTRRGKIVVRSGLAITALVSAGTLYAGYQYQHPEITCRGTTRMSLEPTQGEDSVVAAMVSNSPQLSGLSLYQLRATVEEVNPALQDPSDVPQVGEIFKVPTNCNAHVDLF